MLAQAITLVRDLVNTPAEHMGPAQLADAAQAVAKAHGARFSQVVGDALLKKNFPAIHAVGRAADGKHRAPRLIRQQDALGTKVLSDRKKSRKYMHQG